MESPQARVMVATLRQRILGRFDAVAWRDYRTNRHRLRLYRFRTEWIHPLAALLLVVTLPSSKSLGMLGMLYATGLAFWMAGELRAQVYGRGVALAGYFPVSDSEYFLYQWKRVLSRWIPYYLALLLLEPTLNDWFNPEMVFSEGMFGHGLLFRAVQPPPFSLQIVSLVAWPALHLALAFPSALAIYRLAPRLPSRFVAAFVWVYLALAAILVPVPVGHWVALTLLPSGWIEALRQCLYQPVTAPLLGPLALVPLVIALASYRHILAAACGTFYIQELILSTPGDPSPSVPTGPGSDESPADVTDTSPAAQLRRRKRRELMHPTALQALRSEMDQGNRMWTQSWVERAVASILTADERSLVRFLAGGRLDWSARYRKAVAAALVGTLAVIAPCLFEGRVLAALGWSSLPSRIVGWSEIEAVVLWGSPLIAAACCTISLIQAAPLLGGQWPGLSPIQASPGASPPMYVGFPVAFAESFRAILKVNLVRVAFWLPLPALQVSTAMVILGGSSEIQYLLHMGSPLVFGLSLVLMAQPAAVAARFLTLGHTGGTTQVGAVLTACVLFLGYAGLQFLSLIIWSGGPPFGKAMAAVFSSALSALAGLAVHGYVESSQQDLLYIPADSDVVMDH